MDLGNLVDKAKDLAGDQSEKIEQGIDKAAEFADSKLDEKHDGKIEKAKDMASDFVGKLGGNKDEK